MPKLIISHKNACNGVIPDGYLIYDSVWQDKKNKIVEFYVRGHLIARLRGDFAIHTFELDDSIFEDETEDLINGK